MKIFGSSDGRRTGLTFLQFLPMTASRTSASRSLAWSSDGKLLASAIGGGEQPIDVWDWQSATRLFRLEGHAIGVTALAWNPEATRLASAGGDGRIRVWDRDGRLIESLKLSQSHCRSLAWHPDGGMLAVGMSTGRTTLWDLSTEDTKELEGHTFPVIGVAWRPQGDQLAVVTEDHSLHIFEPQVTETPRTLIHVQTPFRSIFWSGDGAPLYVVADVLLQWNQRDDGLIILPGSRDGFLEPWIDGCWLRRDEQRFDCVRRRKNSRVHRGRTSRSILNAAILLARRCLESREHQGGDLLHRWQHPDLERTRKTSEPAVAA